MKIKTNLSAAGMLLAGWIFSAHAATRYVNDANPTPVPLGHPATRSLGAVPMGPVS